MDLRGQIELDMAQVPGFGQIDSHSQHYVITDIVTRFEVVRTMWANSTHFAANYVKWVENLILVDSEQSADMWENWAKLLKKLYLGN